MQMRSVMASKWLGFFTTLSVLSTLNSCTDQSLSKSESDLQLRPKFTDPVPRSLLSNSDIPTFTEKIIGDNDLINVRKDSANIPEKYRKSVNAIGLLTMGCTITHIGNGVALTAGHCFSAKKEEERNLPCDGNDIYWGFRGTNSDTAKARSVSKCVRVLAMRRDFDLDYAIIQVSPPPSDKIDVDLSGRPAPGTKMTIFGYPQMRPLEWSQTCTFEPISNFSNLVGSVYGPSMFAHQCDTEEGNSGSPVITDATAKLTGIHDGGLEPWNFGTFIADTPLKEVLELLASPNPFPTMTASPLPIPTGTPEPVPTPTPVIIDPPALDIRLPDRGFGPFTNPAPTLLTSIAKSESVSRGDFNLEFSPGSAGVRIIIRSGDGQISQVTTEKLVHKFTNIILPISFFIVGDVPSTSREAAITNILIR